MARRSPATDDLVGVRTAMDVLSLSKPRIHQLIASGRLPARKVGGIYVLRRSDLDDFARIPREPGNPGLKK